MTEEKVKRPASQYYWGDWWKDKALHSCSQPARGLWHEMNCLMHEGEPYGHLTVNGKPMTTAQLANLCRISASKAKTLVEELEGAGVFSRAADGAIYSRRMVRDELLRETRAEAGRQNGIKGKEFGALGAEHGAKGGRPRTTENPGETPPPEPREKPPQNPHPSSSSSSASSSSASAFFTQGEVVGGAAQTLTPPPPYLGERNEAGIPKAAKVLLAQGWELPEPWGNDAEALGFTPPEILRESEKFRQYWVSGNGAGTRRSVKGWRQSWSNWLGKAEASRRFP